MKMEKNYDFEKIEDFLTGQLSAEDQAAFSAQIDQDTTLAQVVDFEKDLLIGVATAGKADLVDTIQSVAEEMDLDAIDIPIYGEFSDEALSKGIHQVGKEDLVAEIGDLQAELDTDGFFDEVFEKVEATGNQQSTTEKTAKVRTLFPIRRVLSIAAGVALLILGGWLAFFQNSGSPLDQHFTPYANVVSPTIDAQLNSMGAGTSNELQADLSDLQQGMQAYDAKNYSLAIDKLTNKNLTILASKDRQLVNFYLALSHLAVKNMDAAIPLLTTLAGTTGFAQRADAQWYLLLAYAEKGDTAQVAILKAALKGHPEYGAMVVDF